MNRLRVGIPLSILMIFACLTAQAQCACTDCRCSDSLELVKLYNATNGANWTVRNVNGTTSPWVLTQPMARWYGIALTNGRVSCIDLDGSFNCFSSDGVIGNNLIGTIPNFNLNNLENLHLSNNQLNSNIPNFNLPNLRILHIYNTQLSGEIPNFNLPNLEELNLSSNQLSGNIPNFNLPNLQELVLVENQLNGIIPNFNLPNLGFLFLYDNQLSGFIPNFNLPELYSLSLSGNQLSGPIPNFSLPNLLRLYLYGNQLNGSIPNFNLPNLQRIELYSNQLSGSIPNFNLPNLQYLSLYSNQLSGNIPLFQNLSQLRQLYLNNNKLSSCFPTEWQRFCRFRYNPNVNNYVDSSYNITGNPQLAWQGDFQRFCNNEPQIGASCNDSLATTINDKIQADCTCKGTLLVDTTTCRYKDSIALVAFYRATNMQNVPPQYKWNLSQPITTWYGVTLDQNGCVKCLDLDGGAVNCDTFDLNPTGIGLVGTLPDSIRLLTSLERMQLQGNTGLGGVFPTNFGNLSSLKQFYVYNCRFTGPFPTSFWQLPNIEDIDLNDNPLNMSFPSEFGNFRKLKGLHLCTTGLTGAIPQSIGTLDSLGNLDICDNQLTGSVPNNLTSRPRLQVLQIEKNKLDVLPTFSVAQFRSFFPFWTPFFSIQNNRFTFDDILPNMPIINRISATYANQDSIFQNITYTQNVGDNLTINLGIDGALTTNKYVWIKNGVRVDSSNQNTKILRGLTPCDAGTYRCEVTNAAAPLLTLKSRIIKIIVNGTNERPLSISICSGQKHTLPKGVIVSKSGIYRDTFRTSNGCDSSIVTTVTVSPPIITPRNKTILEGQKDTLPKGRIVHTEGVYQDSFRTANGCDSVVVTTLTIRKILIDETCFEEIKKNMPDAFSPNDDGINELFDPEKYFILSGCPASLRAEQLIIVNRWGEVIYKANPYQAWDGKSSNYKNAVMPSAYYYVLVFKIDGKERLVKGVINCFSR